MNTATATPLMTAAEFIRDYGDSSGVELVNGQLVRLPMPGAKHGQIGLKAGALILMHVMNAECGRVVGLDTFIRTKSNPDAYRGADAAFISYERLPKSEPTPIGPFEIPPEFVVEVRSPSDRWKSVRMKIDEYLAAGVVAVAIIDPTMESFAIYRDDEFPVIFHNGDIVTVPDVLPGFAVPVKKFFE